MADDRIREEIITEFFLKTCQLRRWVNDYDVDAMLQCSKIAAIADIDGYLIPLTTGSAAEFYIEPMLSCVGDLDIMFHRSDELAIPAGYPPPTQLPGEFDRRIVVFEIVDSEFPGYVYLVSSYSLMKCLDDDKYKATQRKRQIVTYNLAALGGDSWHGPALFHERPFDSVAWSSSGKGPRVVETRRSMDDVPCVRCLIWPPQAADWQTRHRNYGWPDSATVECVVRNVCDVVPVAHYLCRQVEWMRQCQWRLSFSRAEIVLLNSWMPVQQIVYHMLRYFMKNEILTDSANDTGGDTLSNYHIKTLMLWACELKPKSWWTDDLNLVSICVELLHTLAVWLTDARCQHYFINNCNLFDRLENSQFSEVTASRLISITTAWFCEWYIENYIHKLCLSGVWGWAPHSSRLHAVVYLQEEVCAVVEWKRLSWPVMTSSHFFYTWWLIMKSVSLTSLTLRSCLCWMNQLAKTDQTIRLYSTAVVFLHGAYKTTQTSLTDEMLDVLAATCLQLGLSDARRCITARNSSVLSLGQAAMLMKVVANNSRSTVQLIEIELAKAYLHRALRCKESDSNSVYCLANVYLSIFYYTAGQYQKAINHCTLVTRLQDHSQCRSHVVQGELLPAIDDQIVNTTGLAMFYQYIRAAALNEKQERRHVSVFTTELVAHYLHIKFLSITKCRQFPRTSVTDEIRQYRKSFFDSLEVFVTDVILFVFANRTGYPSSGDRLMMADRGERKSLVLHQLDTSKLVQLLQQSAVEHLTTCYEFQASDFYFVVIPDFKALYAYKCGQYQHCFQLSMHNVRKMIVLDYTVLVSIAFFRELVQLLDDDIASLIGLMKLVNHKRDFLPVAITGLSLSLYLLTQCQIKLRHPVTSLVTTLDYVHVARGKIRNKTKFAGDKLLLKFVEQQILKY